MENENKKTASSSENNTEESSHLKCGRDFYKAWGESLKQSVIPAWLKKEANLFFQGTVEWGQSQLKMDWDTKKSNAVFLYARERSKSLLRMIEAQLGVVT